MTSAPGRTSCICPRKEILHLSPEGDPTSPTKRTPFFGSRKDTLLRLPDGYSSSSPERSSCLDPGRKPFLCHRKDTLHSPPREETLHLPPDGHPVSATKSRPYIGPQKETQHRPSGGPHHITGRRANICTRKGSTASATGRRPRIGHREKTIHRLPKRHPAEGTRRSPC